MNKKQLLAPQVFKNLKEYRTLIRSMDGTAMQIFSCPKATANEVMCAQQRLVQVHESYKEVERSVQQHFKGYEPRWWVWQ